MLNGGDPTKLVNKYGKKIIFWETEVGIFSELRVKARAECSNADARLLMSILGETLTTPASWGSPTTPSIASQSVYN